MPTVDAVWSLGINTDINQNDWGSLLIRYLWWRYVNMKSPWEQFHITCVRGICRNRESKNYLYLIVIDLVISEVLMVTHHIGYHIGYPMKYAYRLPACFLFYHQILVEHVIDSSIVLRVAWLPRNKCPSEESWRIWVIVSRYNKTHSI